MHSLPDNQQQVTLAIQMFKQTSRDVAVATAAEQAANNIFGSRLSTKNILGFIGFKLTKEDTQKLIDAAHSIVEKYTMCKYFFSF
jgi:hypothetical protein